MLIDIEKYKQKWNWRNYSRPEQLEPDSDWLIWLIKTGRGWGKTRTGSETLLDKVRKHEWRNIALVGQSSSDMRETMIDELRLASGIMACAGPWERVEYQPSKRRILFHDYSAVAHLYSAEDPDQLRGPQHDAAWCDELAAWPRTTRQLAWDNLMFGLRKGASQCIVTTTPRPIKILRDIMARERTVLTEGSTYDNLSNLSEAYKTNVIKPYEGTRLGRQELQGQILDDNPDALWSLTLLDEVRVKTAPIDLDRVVIAVDPAGSKEGHEVGIIAAGRRREKAPDVGYHDCGYLLGDYSMHASPSEWAERCLTAYDMHEADCIVVEDNFGGEMVASTITLTARALGRSVPHVKSVHATRGKVVRAEPVSALSEQRRIKHVGPFPKLEEQMVDFIAGDADDRVDAYVWAFTDLIAGKEYELHTW